VRHRKKGKKLGVNPSHRRALLANLAENLIIHKRIKTTDARAKELRRYIEPLVTKAKKGDLNSIRMIAKKIRHKNILNILLSEIAPVYDNRNGGYTRIIKLGFRDNDRASVSLIEFVDMEGTKKIEGIPVSKEIQETE
jgi:large subunit ribosomal protein L17